MSGKSKRICNTKYIHNSMDDMNLVTAGACSNLQLRICFTSPFKTCNLIVLFSSYKAYLYYVSKIFSSLLQPLKRYKLPHNITWQEFRFKLLLSLTDISNIFMLDYIYETKKVNMTTLKHLTDFKDASVLPQYHQILMDFYFNTTSALEPRMNAPILIPDQIWKIC